MAIKNGFFTGLLELLGVYRNLLDIGSDEIRMIGGIVLFGRMHVMDFWQKNIAGPLTPAVLKEAVAGYSGRPVHLSFSGTNCMPITISIPKIPNDRLKSVLPSEIEKNLPVIFSDIHYHYRVLSRSVESGVARLNILAVCIRKEELRKVTETLRTSRIRVEAVIYLPLSLPNALKEKYTAGRNGIVVLRQHAIHLSVLENGSLRSFTTINGSVSKSSGIAMKNIAHYYQDYTKTSGTVLERIAVLPAADSSVSAAQIKTLESLTGCKTVLLKDADLRFKTGPGIDAEKNSDLIGYFSDGSAGSAMPLEPAKFNGVLQKALVSFLWLCIAADIFFICFIPTQAVSILQNGNIQKVRAADPSANAGQEQKILSQRIRKVSEMEAIMNQVGDLRARIAAQKNAGIPPTRKTAVIAEISRLIPDDTRIRSLTMNDRHIQITGSAAKSASVEIFVRSLSASKIFRSVSLNNTRLTGESQQEAVDFQVNMEAAFIVNPEANSEKQ